MQFKKKRYVNYTVVNFSLVHKKKQKRLKENSSSSPSPDLGPSPTSLSSMEEREKRTVSLPQSCSALFKEICPQKKTPDHTKKV